MIDGIKKLYIEPTSACNLNCSMCFRNNWIDEKKGFMSEETFKNIIKGIKNESDLESVMFGGMGEPLLHKNIVSMVYAISEQKIKTELITNATLLTKNLSDMLLNSGLSCLWVSVDGFKKEAYEKIQKGAEFELIKRNIEYFNTNRGNTELGMTFVIMDENIVEIEKINRFADAMGFDYINLSYNVPSSPLKEDISCYDTGFLIGKQRRIKFNEFHKRRLNYCPFINEDNCFVKWNGDVSACMQLLHSSYTYLFEEKREVVAKSFGNVNNLPLPDIWRSEEYVKLRKLVKDFEFPDCTVCDGCDDRLSNLTDCMYNTFPTCGACLWAQGIGRCP